MNRDKTYLIFNSKEESFLLSVDEERNKDLEKRFLPYINQIFIFDEKIKSNIKENKNKNNKENKTKSKIIKFAKC